MPQDGSNNYQYPPGTPGIPDQTIESEAYNTFLDDLITNDLNIPRPIHRGGTGASTADAAVAALGGEKAGQLVTNFDSHLWLAGSFYCAANTPGAPSASAFAGWVYSADPPQSPPLNQNIILHAYDLTTTPRPGRLYTKEKKAGVWAAAWTIETNISVGALPPAGVMRDGSLWWDNDNGVLYVYYNDGNSTQWVQAVALPSINTSLFVQRGGDAMTGPLTLPGAPTVDLHAATKLYVDAGVSAGVATKVNKAGDTMSGLLTLSGAPTALLHAATKQYVDEKLGAQRFSISGVQIFDVSVPAAAQLARVTVLIRPSSAAPMLPCLQLFLGSAFLGVGNYATYGHYNSTNAAAISVLHNATNLEGFLVSLTHDNAGLPVMASGLIAVRRDNLGQYFTGDFTATSFSATGINSHCFATSYVNTGQAALNVAALRLISSTGAAWAAGSYLNVEWL